MSTRDKVITLTHFDMPRRWGAIHYGSPDTWSNPVESTTPSLRGSLPLLEYKTSYSTPGWNKVEKHTFLVPVPRKRADRKPPAVPRYFPPKFPKEPIFKRPARSKKAKKARELIMRRYQARLYLYRFKKQSYELNYASRIAKFYIRLAKYTAWLQKTYFRKVKKVRKVVHKASVNHPYDHVRISNTGFNGYYIDRTNCWLYAYGTHPGESYLIAPYPGESTYSVRAFGGFCGDDFYGEPDMVSPVMGLFYPTPPSLTSMTLASDNKAVGKVFQLLNEHKLHVAQIIAERHQTIELVLDTAKKLAKFIKRPMSIFEGLAPDLRMMTKKTAKFLSNNHLVYCFGVEPLVADCYAAGEQLARLIHEKPRDRVVVHGRGRVTDRINTQTDWSSFIDYHQMDIEVKTSYVLEYHIDNPVSAELQAFGLVNPAEIAWELTPWSFVIDWFLPLGNYITSLTADMGLSYVTGTKTVKTTITYNSRRVFKGPIPGAPGRTVYGELEGSRRTETQYRTVLTEPPVPCLPTFKNPFSVRHIGLSLALLVQKLKK